MARKGRKRKSDNSKVLTAVVILVVLLAIGFSQRDTISSSVGSLGDSNQNIGYVNSSDLLKVGAFNIQVFGQAKAENPEVMNILAQIIRGYDIIGIEEIRDSSNTALVSLIDLVNSDGSKYAYTLSERLGRTTSKEQYAYIYNTATVNQVGDAFIYPETTDIFHREPYLASFASNAGLFNATFVLIHTDPDEAQSEIYSLYEVAEYAKGVLPQEDTVIVLGDFNADGSYFNEKSSVPLISDEYVWVIGDDVDTTVGANNYTYDRIVLSKPNVWYAGDSGTIHFDEVYNLSSEFAKSVSDHYPIYAIFSKGL